MDKKKILIVSSSFFPENSPRSFRTTELAKEFARQGHFVRVITHKSTVQDQLVKEFEFEIADLGKVRWKPFSIRGKGITRLFWRGISRFLGLLMEYPNIQLVWMVKKVLQKEQGYDLLISIAVPHPVHWGVASIRSKDHPIATTWVADCGDPYVGQENDSFKVPFYFRYVEKWFCRKAGYLSVPTEGAIKAYFEEFHNKIKVIPQGFKFEDFMPVNTLTKNDCPHFAYAGQFIPGRRDPREMLDYLLTIDEPFIFYIYTNTPTLAEPYIEKAKGRILLLPFIPRIDLLQELAGVDFVVNFENVGSKQTPSKLIDYAIINKPILPIKTNALNTTALNEFLAGNYRQQYIVENPDQYRIENICQLFLNLCTDNDISQG